MGIPSQVKTQDVVVPGSDGLRNGGTSIAVTADVSLRAGSRQTGLFDTRKKPGNPRVSYRSVFDVRGARLAIGHFSRPLAAEERSLLTRAWERSGLAGVEDFEVSADRVSFLAPPAQVDATWQSIEALLSATPSLAKAS